MPRFVAIDDTDPSIQYSGPWIEVNNTQIDTGLMGPPFQNTLHGVNVSASFSFIFSGSAVVVYGTVANSSVTNASRTQDPPWECFIDNTAITWFLPPTDGTQNNWALCGGGPPPATQFQDGPHSLTVTVNTNVSNQQTFWFDQIQYAPSASVSLNQSIMRIDSNDSAIEYDSPAGGWSYQAHINNEFSELLGGNTSSTQITGATLTYQFFGTSISFFADDLGFTFNESASANYIVDEQDPIIFPVPLPPSPNVSDAVYTNQKLFETEQLPLGQHKLVVTYLGNLTTVPLFFDHFVQQIGPSTSNASTSTSVPSSSSSNSSSSTTGAIIGGVIGGLALVSLLLALFFFSCRHKNRISQALSEMISTVPSPNVVIPFTSPSSNPNFTSNGQSLPSRPISGKFSHQRDHPLSTSSGPPLTPLRRPRSSSPVSSPSGSSPLSPLRTLESESQTNHDDSTRIRIPQPEQPSVQRSASPQGANVRILRHNDSGVRMPAEVGVVELPPFYTRE